MNRRPRVGLTDVAHAAGVSTSTASRALRQESRVSSKTTQHVLAIAASLGYVPDRRAADLASAEPTTIGLLLRGAERSFYGEIAAQVQAVTDVQNIDLLIVNGGDTHASQMRGINNLLGHRVAGIMIASGRASLEAAAYAASFVPTVLIGLESTNDTIDSVSIDRASETLLARHVLKAGHKHIAVITSDLPEASTLRQRTARYITELKTAGTTISRISYTDNAADLWVSTRSVLEDGATVIMAGDDPTAVKILEILQQHGKDCPDDISVTGFDGVGVFRTPLFGLATIRQPVELMAKAASELMTKRLKQNETPVMHATFPGEYVPGKTLGTVHR